MQRSKLLFLIPLFLMACDSNLVYEENLKIEQGIWNRAQNAQFLFEVEDSTQAHNFYINFRHAGDYPYKNLYLFTRIKSPNGKIAKDTAQMILADNKGRWMGKSIGDIYDYQFKFKEQFKFPETGEYLVEIEQAMRDERLDNVTDIGIRVEKIKK
mgnify:FL=1